MKKIYFAFFCLRTNQKEHVKIQEVIRRASGGQFTRFVLPPGVAYLYESEQAPWDISFDRILHNDDTRVMFEVGEHTLFDGFGAAAGWLNARRPRR